LIQRLMIKLKLNELRW